MNIGNKRNSAGTGFLIGAILLLSVIYVLSSSDSLSGGKAKAKNSDIDWPTEVYKGYSYSDIIVDTLNSLYSDENVSLYLIKEFNTPFLLYVYKDSLNERQRTDRFYLHVYKKDSAVREAGIKREFLNMDFNAEPFNLNVGGREYFLFKKFLTHDSLNINEIDFINTGRFKRGESVSLKIQELKIGESLGINITNNLPVLDIRLREKDYLKIYRKREEAVANGVLISNKSDLVNAFVTYDTNEELAAEIRLKGDWTDHLDDPVKWSYRIITDGLATVNGMRKFSVQHPKVRNYLWEWLFNQVAKENDLVGLRYEFVNVSLKLTKNKEVIRNIPMGIMAMEEAFDKILLENNRRREGLILGFDESLIWKDRYKQNQLLLEDEARSPQLQAIKNAPIRVYNQNKVLEDPKLHKQFVIARDLLDGVRKGEISLTEAFDVDKLTTFVALTNLFGGVHGLVLHNLRVYYNPITNKLEPISFDSNSGTKLNQIKNYPFSKNDLVYEQKLVEKLEWVSSSAFVNGLVRRHYAQLTDLGINLSSEFNDQFDLSVLEYNSNYIKKAINPSTAIIAELMSYDENNMILDVRNVSEYQVEVKRLEHDNGRNLSKRSSIHLLEKGENKIISFPLKKSFVNAFVSKKNKKGSFRYPNDVEKINVEYSVTGSSVKGVQEIVPYSRNLDLAMTIGNYRESFESNIGEFKFIEIDESSKIILLKSGNHIIRKNLTIPSGYLVKIESGHRLDLQNGAYINSYSAFHCNGTKENPVEFHSSDGSGKGIFVTNTTEISLVEHTIFDNLSNPDSGMWEVSGAVNFHEAPVKISHASFSNNRCEDALNIIRSEFEMENVTFSNTLSDAFDGDFVKGSIRNSKFFNTGNDAIDVSGSQLELSGIEISNPSDKGISAGEASSINGDKIQIDGGEIGIVSKDLSTIVLDKVSLSNTRLGFSAFQKKSEFGTGRIEITNAQLINNELDYLVESGSELFVDGQIVETVSNSVLDQMYGNEYGKSSK